MRVSLIFLILIYCFISVSYVDARWYGNHPVSYSTSPAVRNCDGDGDSYGGSHPSFWERAVANNNNGWIIPETSTYSVSAAGSMRCLYWDSASPLNLGSSAISYTAWWVNSNQTITWRWRDRWWSRLRQILIQRTEDNGANWSNFRNWDSLWWGNNTLITRLQTQSIWMSSHWKTYRYRTYTRDYAGNPPRISSMWWLMRVDLVWPQATLPVYRNQDNSVYAPWTWTNQNVTVRINCNDNDGNPYSWCNMSARWGFSPSGSNYLRTFSSNTTWFNGTLQLLDNSGSWNSRNISYWTIRIDKTTPWAPTITANDRGNDVWSNDNSTTLTATVNTSWQVWPRFNRYCMVQFPTTTCIPNSTTAPSTTSMSDGVYYFRARTCTQAWNCSWITQFILKIDTVVPVATDITSVTSPNLLANHSYPIELSIDRASWSPIAEIRWRFENWNSRDNLLSQITSNSSWTRTTTSWSTNWNVTQNICNVENNINQNSTNCNVTNTDGSSLWWNGWREYRFIISYVRDEAWNIYSWSARLNYNVYSDTTNITTRNINHINISSWLIANNQIKNVTITLKDRYENGIIDATWISRQIWIDMNIFNDLRLNQHLNTWSDSAIDIWATTIPIWNISYINWSVPWVIKSSSGWIFTLPFRIYWPTSNADSFVPWNATISSMWYNITWTSIFSGDTWSGSIPSSTFDLQVNSPFRSNFWSELDGRNVFIEWAQQTSTLRLENNWMNVGVNKWLFLEFGADNVSRLTLTWNLLLPSNWRISEYLEPLSSLFLWNSSFPISWVTPYSDLHTSMTLDTPPLPNISTAYLATIINYQLPSKNITYPSDIINKSTYHDPSTLWSVSQVAVKIVWNTSSQNTEEILNNQFSNDVRLLWEITKSSLRSGIESRVYNVIRNISTSSISWNVTNLWGIIWWNPDGESMYAWKVLLFRNPSSGRVEIFSDSIEGNKTLIVENGDVYIRWNIQNDDAEDILWIIVLSGSVLIDTSVTDIDAVIYTNRSIHSSTDWTNKLDWSVSQSQIANQLYIKWSIFTENTIGWSRSTPVKCPYYVQAWDCTNSTEAQAYDLNYLRRYFTYDSWSWYDTDTTGDGNPDKNRTGQISQWGINNPVNAIYPVVIEYNPAIQSVPPPFFD